MSIVSDTITAHLPAKRKTTPRLYKYTTRSVKGMYYLYVKTHNKTNLKYLGQTSQNPFEYSGSGTRWVNHLNIHGDDVTTEILLETNSKTELSNAGLYYSNLYNVVEDYNWANIVLETGSGGDTSQSPNYVKSLETRDYSYKQDNEYKLKVSESVELAWEEKFKDPNFNIQEYKKMCSERSKKMWKTRGVTDEDRLLRSIKQKEYLATAGVKESLSKKAKENWLKKSKTYEVLFPDGHIEIIKSLRGWCKDNNYPYYKLYNTIKNNRPSPEGWQVKIIK